MRHWCPLSVIFCVILVEVFLQNRNIEGINKNGKEIKVSAFADDTTLYIGNNNSLKHLESQLAYFEHYAGVKYNRDKCSECGSELI